MPSDWINAINKAKQQQQINASPELTQQQEKATADRLAKEKDIRQGRIAETTSSLESWLKKGQQRGQELFAPGSLGRLSMSSGEGAMLRQNAQEGLRRQMLAQQRALRIQQGRSGITGAAAQAGQFELARSAAEGQRALESDILNRELAMRQFNLGQQAKELAGRSGLEFGYGGLGQQIGSSAINQILGEAMARSQGVNPYEVPQATIQMPQTMASLPPAQQQQTQKYPWLEDWMV